ncbi:MAG: hypothetical protein ACKVZJ_03665 [Phycisphaerales bacterium]
MPSPPPDPPDRLTLTPAQARAVDAILGAGDGAADPAAPPATALPTLPKILALLDLPLEPIDPERRRLLIDITMARVMRSAESDSAGRIGIEPAHEASPSLSTASATELDAAAEAGWSTSNPRLSALLSALDAAPIPTDSARRRLVGSTLDRIQSESESRFRLRIPDAELAPRARRRITLSDILAAAACVGLAGLILAPMVVNARAVNRETVCAMNMGRAGLGFSLFANDHDGALPSVQTFDGIAPAPAAPGAIGPAWPSSPQRVLTLAIRTDAQGRPLAAWWSVGADPASHTANLFTLVRGGYVSTTDLACPGNETAQTNFAPGATDWANPDAVSYSYQLFGPETPRWFSGHTKVVLADRSPVVDRARRGETPDPLAPSTNHPSRGQNVLFNTGAVTFLNRPVLDNGDNIWLPRSLEGVASPQLNGAELPATETDAFVGP